MTEWLGEPAVLAEQGRDANAVYSLGSSEGETARLPFFLVSARKPVGSGTEPSAVGKLS